MSVALRKRRKLPSAPARGLSWVGEEGVTVADSKIKPDLDRFARLPPHVLAQLKEVERDNVIIPGQKFTDITVTDDGPDVSHDKTTTKGKTVSIHLQQDTFRRIAGIREFVDVKNSYLIRKVDIRKSPTKSLGFYICEGDGWNRQDGIFISRLVLGSYIEVNNFLRIGDEIMKVNEVYVNGFTLNDVALMMQVVEKLVLTVKVLTSASHMRRHSTRLAISSNTFSTEALLSSTQLASFSATQPQAITDRLTEKINSGTFDPQGTQTHDAQHTELKHDTSVGLSVSQVLDEGYHMLDNSTLTVDMHNSMTQDVNKDDAPQVHEMDILSTAIINDVSESTANDTLPEKNNKQVVSTSDSASGSGDTDTDSGDDNEYDQTDFALFRRIKKRKKKRTKKISPTNDTYEVKKSFWQTQEESIAMEDKIDPIRDMEDTDTTFTGEKVLEIRTNIKISEEIDSHGSQTSPDHNKSSTDPQEVTVMIKVKHLSDISSFAPQDLFCCIFVDDVKKASTTVKAVQGTNVYFNEQFFIDLPGSSELRIKICKPAEIAIGAVEHILSARAIKLPNVTRKPEEYSLEITSLGVLTMDIQVLPLESVIK